MEAFHGFQPSWDQSPGLLSTEPYFNLHISAGRMDRSGHFHPEAPQVWHSYSVQAKFPHLQLPLLLGSQCLPIVSPVARVRNQFTFWCMLSRSGMSDSLQPYILQPAWSSAHVIFQARLLQWHAISYSRISSRPRDWTCISRVSCTDRFFTISATWEAHALIIWLTLDSSFFPSRIFIFSLILFHHCLD